MTRQYARNVAIGIAVLGFLTLASFVSTYIIWDGFYRPAEFRLNIRSIEGQPVEGAVLRVYQGGTREFMFEHPLDNHLLEKNLTSDANGRILALSGTGDTKFFSGCSWHLFWLVPMGDGKPEIDCEISAQGYRPLRFSYWALFETGTTSPQVYSKCMVIVNGREAECELPVYEHTFTMQR